LADATLGPAQLEEVYDIPQTSSPNDPIPTSILAEVETKKHKLKATCEPLLANVRAAFGIEELKRVQVDALEALYDGQDVLCIAGTGSANR